MFGFSALVPDAYSNRLKNGTPALLAEVVGTLLGKGGKEHANRFAEAKRGCSSVVCSVIFSLRGTRDTSTSTRDKCEEAMMTSPITTMDH